jgi:hypothetical protein
VQDGRRPGAAPSPDRIDTAGGAAADGRWPARGTPAGRTMMPLIDEHGRALLARFGGEARLRACAK